MFPFKPSHFHLHDSVHATSEEAAWFSNWGFWLAAIPGLITALILLTIAETEHVNYKVTKEEYDALMKKYQEATKNRDIETEGQQSPLFFAKKTTYIMRE